MDRQVWDGGDEAEPLQRFLEEVAITQASRQRAVYGLGGGAEVVVPGGGKGQGMS